MIEAAVRRAHAVRARGWPARAWLENGLPMLVRIPDDATPLADAVWIDLLDLTPDERSVVEAATKVRLPSRANMEEIESSSRVYLQDGALYLGTVLSKAVHSHIFPSRLRPLWAMCGLGGERLASVVRRLQLAGDG